MICGSSIPVHYFYFYCNPVPRTIYLIINVSFSLILSKLVTDDNFQRNGGETKRAVVFLAYGFSSLFPFLHYIYNGMDGLSFREAYLLRVVFMALVYSFGAIMYAAYVPERFFPGSFDLVVILFNLFYDSTLNKNAFPSLPSNYSCIFF